MLQMRVSKQLEGAKMWPGAQKSYDSARCGAYLQQGDLWMGFDDEDSVRCKAQFIKDRGLIGALKWP